MKKSLFKQPLFYTTVLSLSLLGLIIGSYVFGWVVPTATPPGGNISLTNYWTLSGTYLFPTSTSYNVGIGTTTPSEKLEVAGGNLKVGGSIKDSAGNLIYDDATKKIPSARLPFDQGDITSDWSTNSWASGYYDVANLSSANVKSGITFGRGATGTLITGCSYISRYWDKATQSPTAVCASYGGNVLYEGNCVVHWHGLSDCTDGGYFSTVACGVVNPAYTYCPYALCCN